MATFSLPQTITHPAWKAIECRFLRDARLWRGYWEGTHPAYTPHQVAEAMIAAGYAADLIVIERDEEGRATSWQFPDRQIPFAPEDAGHRRTGRHQFNSTRWLVARVLDEGMRLCEVSAEFERRHEQERGHSLVDPYRSMRAIIANERRRRCRQPAALCYSEPTHV